MINNLFKTCVLSNTKNLVKKAFVSASGYNTERDCLLNYFPLNYFKDLNQLKNYSDNKQVIQKVYKKMAEKPKVVFVLGGPGAGKGTQCQKIVEEFGFIHLSAGDLLRAERSREGSEYGEMIEKCIRDGTIVPVEVTCSLLDNAMQHFMKERGKLKFLIDGFPRNQDNLNGWNKKMSDKVDFMFVLFFNCDQQICVNRCLDRGKAGSGRSDDNEESLKKRICTYTNDSLKIIEHYRKLNKVRQINAAPEPDVVFEEVKQIFQKEIEHAN